MGTDVLMASMQKRAAANASGRWGEETTTTTADAPTGTTPTAVEEHDPADRRPPSARLVGDRLQPRHDLLLVRLVLQLLYARSIRCVVARRPAEQHDRSAIRPDGPFRGAADGQVVVSQTQPHVAGCRWSHARIVGEPGPPSLGAGASLSSCAVPPDDESDDDAPEFGAPLPPDDRLWRHPSELGPIDGLADVATEGDQRRSASALWGVAVVAGLVGAALSLGVVAMAGGFNGKVVEKPVVEKVPVRAVAEDATQPSGVVGVTRAVAPVLVRIEATTRKGSAVGSGVLFRDDGYLVTDAHLVQSASAVQVTLADGRSVPGTMIGSDAWSAIAVIKVDAGQVPVATFGSATGLQIGQTAIAIGAPQGPSGGPSVTVGVVSAVGKQVNSLEGVSLRDMIETDAAAADESSGGALSDANGVLIGVVTTVAQPDGANLDFAAPIDVVRSVAEDIITTGTARHTWLGVEGADADGGARVTKVAGGSPAAQAGLSNDDVIAAVDGTKIVSMSALRVALRGHHTGETITLVVSRSGQDLTMTATLGEKTPS